MKHYLAGLILLLSVPSFATLGPPPAPFSTTPDTYELRRDYSHIDPEQMIDPVNLQIALRYYELNYNRIPNKNYMTLIDFGMHANEERLFLINMRTGRVQSFLVSVGRGSDPDGDGNADTFSNRDSSHMSSLGFYLTDEVYSGGNGRSMRLHGLSSTNSNAYSRNIVMHGASYVSQARNYAGRSQGCPAVDDAVLDLLINTLRGASLMYIFQSGDC